MGYDGSIKIDTSIDTKKASSQLLTLENRIVKTADKIASLRSKMDSLKNAKIPTQEYQEISVQIEKAEQKFNKLLEKQEQMQREGKDNGVAWQRLNDQMEEVGNEIRYAKGELQDLVDSGKAFKLGSSTEEFTNLSNQLNYAEADLAALNNRHDELIAKQGKASEGYKKLGSTIKKSFDSMGTILKKANALVDSFGKRIKNIAQRIFPIFRKETESSNTSLSKFGTRLKSLLSGIFIFNVISAGFRNMFAGIREGFANFYEQNNAFKASVDSLRSRLLQLKNALAAAFAPIVQMAIPYLETLVSYLTKAANAVAQLIAALLGKSSYTRAVKTSIGAIEGTSSAVDDLKDSAEEAEKAMDKMLSPLDKLNNLSSQKEIKIDTDTGTGQGGTSGGGLTDMFEEVPVDSYFKDLADKIKNVLSKLFAPLKEAWDREGKFVMDSWKYALDEVWKLIKDIGRDFLIVWQQPATVDMFANILHIIGDIGLVVGHLARNFREAWNDNKTGLHILENIRDIFAVIIENIRHAADATVEWADKLNFGPLLEAFERFTESLIPVADSLSGILTDFYEKVLLPLGKWTIEKGLPELLDVLTKFSKTVEWKKLRQNLLDFWDALEPFAETIGEGLILFIDRCGTALAEFINSQEFKDFLDDVADWMSDVKPEDVADGLETVAKSIIALKVGLKAWEMLDGPIKILGTFLTMISNAKIAKAIANLGNAEKGLSFFGKLKEAFALWKGGAGTIGESLAAMFPKAALVLSTAKAWVTGTLIPSLSTALSTLASWSPNIVTFAGIIVVGKQIIDSMKRQFETSEWTIGDWIANTFETAMTGLERRIEGIGVWLELWWQDTWMSDAIWNIEQWWNEKIAPWFTTEKWAELWEMVKLAAETKWVEIKTAIFEKISEIASGVSSKFTEVKVSIATKLSEIRTNISEKLSSIKTLWSNAITFLKTKVINVFDSILYKITSVLDKAKDKIEGLKEKLSGGFSFGGFSFGGSSGGSSFSLRRQASPVAAALSNVEIPGYANGQVIPRTMKQHFAILGDNNKETEVVSPLSTIEQAVENALSKNGSGELTINIPVIIDGREVFRVTQKHAREYKKQTGSPAFG